MSLMVSPSLLLLFFGSSACWLPHPTPEPDQLLFDLDHALFELDHSLFGLFPVLLSQPPRWLPFDCSPPVRAAFGAPLLDPL
jgi:hypothetical protein